MTDEAKTKEQLLDEVVELRRRVAALEGMDIERRRSEEALRQSEERYRLLVDAIPQPVWRCDDRGAVVYFSPRWYEYTGQTADEAVGNGWTKALHPDDVALAAEQVRDAVAKGKGFQIEYRVRRASDGSYRWHLARSIPLKDHEGKILGRFGSAADIDDQKRVEEELRENRAALQTTIGNIPFDFFAIGMDGRYMLQNATSKARWGDAVGKRPEEAAGDKETLALWKENNRRAFAGEKVEEDVTLMVNGEKCYYHNVIAPIIDEGQIRGILGMNIDITEQKRAAEALQNAHDELEEKVKERTAELTKANEDLAIFRKFAEASGQGFGMGDLDGRIAYVNPAMCRLVGEEKPEDMIGKSFFAYYPEEWAERRANEVLPILDREGYWDAEQEIVSRPGKRIPTLHHVFLVRDDSGRPIRRAVVITDITERKQSEEALRQSEERYRTLVEASPEAVLMSDFEGKVTFASQRAAELHGCEAVDELIGRNPLEFIAPEDHPKFFTGLQRIRDEGVSRNVEYTFIKKNGSRFPGEISGAVVKDGSGKPVALMALVRDITQRKAAEEALRVSEERFRSYFVQGLVGMAVTTPDRQCSEVNDRLCEIVGYSREELQKVKWADLNHPDEQETAQLFFDRMLAGEVDHYTRDVRFIRKDGKVIYIRSFVRCFHRKDGTVDHVLALIEDLTERKQAEEALRREHRTLKHMLRASDHERQLIAYDIHDGLAQQLAGAIMQFQTYGHLKDAKPGLAAKAFDAGMTMLHQGHSEARRVISGVRPPILDESGVVAAIAHLVNDQGFKGGPHIVFHSNVEFHRLTPILENVIYRVVQEGLTNASRHSQSKMVRVTLRQRGSRVRIEVRDWGVGFDPKAMSGNHFGLAGIRERTRLLGGRCRIESKPGEGTAILVELPVAERETEE